MGEGPFFRPATAEDQEKISSLIFSILHEYELEPAPKSTDSDLFDIENFYAGGMFDLLVCDDGEIIGSVGLKPVGNDVELRKMYLVSSYRGKGHGARMLKHAIARAQELGAKRIILETARVLEEAVGLYRKFGFVDFEYEEQTSRCDQALVLEL